MEVLTERGVLPGICFRRKTAAAAAVYRVGQRRCQWEVGRDQLQSHYIGASEAPNSRLRLGVRRRLQTQRHTLKFNLEQFFLRCLSGFVFKLKSLF